MSTSGSCSSQYPGNDLVEGRCSFTIIEVFVPLDYPTKPYMQRKDLCLSANALQDMRRMRASLRRQFILRLAFPFYVFACSWSHLFYSAVMRTQVSLTSQLGLYYYC